MHLRQANLERAQNDLNELVETIKEPQHRYYLKQPCREALERMGHDSAVAEQVTSEFFKRTLQ